MYSALTNMRRVQFEKELQARNRETRHIEDIDLFNRLRERTEALKHAFQLSTLPPRLPRLEGQSDQEYNERNTRYVLERNLIMYGAQDRPPLPRNQGESPEEYAVRKVEYERNLKGLVDLLNEGPSLQTPSYPEAYIELAGNFEEATEMLIQKIIFRPYEDFTE